MIKYKFIYTDKSVVYKRFNNEMEASIYAHTEGRNLVSFKKIVSRKNKK